MGHNVQLLQIDSISSLKAKLDPTEPDTLRPHSDATPTANQTSSDWPKLLTFKFNTRTCWVKPVWLRLATLVVSVALTLSPSIVVLNQAKVPVCWIWSQVSLAWVFCELNARATIGINEIHLKPLNTWHLNNFFPHHGTNPPFFQTCAAVFFVCALVQPISSN